MSSITDETGLYKARFLSRLRQPRTAAGAVGVATGPKFQQARCSSS